MTTLPTLQPYLPAVAVDNYLVVALRGQPVVTFGDAVLLPERVNADLPPTAKVQPSTALYVAAVDALPARDLAPGVLALFGHTGPTSFVDHLERAYGTGLPADQVVTIYSLTREPFWMLTDEALGA